MKRLEVYFDSYFLEKIKEEMKEYGIEQYILIPQVFSDWGSHLKHFNSHVWPGTDSILVAYVKDEQGKEIMRVMKNKMSLLYLILLLPTPFRCVGR